MLSEKTIAVIKSTVPVLESHGEQITKRFYQMMFSNHPELLNVFNHANQREGRQQKALASSVYAAAANIDKLETIIPVVKQIGHKHRSLGVKPEHYPIVGNHLLLAIKDVLGDAATDEIINAWAEAYSVIADVFIQVEADMYKEAETTEGGWKDYRSFVVKNKIQENEIITSFYLVPKDGGPLATFSPGQYVSVKMEIPDETYTHMRQYSLSDAPGNDYYRISVKRESATANKEAGIVSTYLHENIQEGDILLLTAPAGDFVLQTDDEPIVLISGGIGITPLLSMLNTIVREQPNRKVTFIQAAINGQHHAFKEHIKQLAIGHEMISSYVCYEVPTADDRTNQDFDHEGYISLDWLQSVTDKNATFYFCGPVPFMKAINSALKTWGVPQEKRLYEFFGPAGNIE